jgi:hypothetical protein
MRSGRMSPLGSRMLSVTMLMSVATVGAFCTLETSGREGPAAYAESTPTVYEAVLKGKTCKYEASNQSLNCEYTVGSGLHFVIEGLGQRDTGISFLKSSADEDFYASLGLLHGCVIVGRGKKGRAIVDVPEFAFVSPRNGKVYKSWEECQDGW